MSVLEFHHLCVHFHKLLHILLYFIPCITDALSDAQQTNFSLKEELAKLKMEIVDVKTAAAISEGSKQDELEDLQRICREEVASIQSIMKGLGPLIRNSTLVLLSITASSYESDFLLIDAMDQAAAKYEQDRAHWMEVNSTLEEELREVKAKLSQDR